MRLLKLSLVTAFAVALALSTASRHGVSSQTIESAMLVLKTEGLLDGRQGKGVYVARPESEG